MINKWNLHKNPSNMDFKDNIKDVKTLMKAKNQLNQQISTISAPNSNTPQLKANMRSGSPIEELSSQTNSQLGQKLDKNKVYMKSQTALFQTDVEMRKTDTQFKFKQSDISPEKDTAPIQSIHKSSSVPLINQRDPFQDTLDKYLQSKNISKPTNTSNNEDGKKRKQSIKFNNRNINSQIIDATNNSIIQRDTSRSSQLPKDSFNDSLLIKLQHVTQPKNLLNTQKSNSTHLNMGSNIINAVDKEKVEEMYKHIFDKSKQFTHQKINMYNFNADLNEQYDTPKFDKINTDTNQKIPKTKFIQFDSINPVLKVDKINNFNLYLQKKQSLDNIKNQTVKSDPKCSVQTIGPFSEDNSVDLNNQHEDFENSKSIPQTQFKFDPKQNTTKTYFKAISQVDELEEEHQISEDDMNEIRQSFNQNQNTKELTSSHAQLSEQINKQKLEAIELLIKQRENLQKFKNETMVEDSSSKSLNSPRQVVYQDRRKLRQIKYQEELFNEKKMNNYKNLNEQIKGNNQILKSNQLNINKMNLLQVKNDDDVNEIDIEDSLSVGNIKPIADISDINGTFNQLNLNKIHTLSNTKSNSTTVIKKDISISRINVDSQDSLVTSEEFNKIERDNSRFKVKKFESRTNNLKNQVIKHEDIHNLVTKGHFN